MKNLSCFGAKLTLRSSEKEKQLKISAAGEIKDSIVKLDE